MGEPPPPPPALSPRAPILLVLLSLAGSSGASGDAGEHKGVAFLCHPSAGPLLHHQLTLLARACLPHRVLASPGGPTREQSLALVARGTALRIAEADPVQAAFWLKRLTGRSGCSGKSKRDRSYRRSVKRTFGTLHRIRGLQKLFCKRLARGPLPSVRRRRALNWPKQLFGGARNSSAPHPGPGNADPPPPATLTLPPGKKELLGPSGARPTPTGPRPSLPLLPTEAGAAHTAGGCRCPGGEVGRARGQPGRDGRARRVGARVPTPRTEEAAWAASALTFLLVVLTLAVLYTRLHQKCRRGRSLYWTASSEEDHDTVAAVIKRRLLSVQVRRKKRPRQQLLPSTSSDSSD